MADNDIPECGNDCYVIDYETRPGTAEAQIYSETVQYPMPTVDGGAYNFAFYPAMRAAFDAEALREMARYTSYGKGCSPGCTCEKDEGATPRKSQWWKVPVNAPYTFPDQSRTISITGYFEMRQLKTLGSCRPAVKRTAMLPLIPEPMAALLPPGDLDEVPKPAAG